MVDVIQVPVYTESVLIYVILSALIFGFIALVLFILVFFRKDYKEMILKTAHVESRVKNLDKSLAGAETIDKRFKDIEKKVEQEIKEVEAEAEQVERQTEIMKEKAKDVERKIKLMDIAAKDYTRKMKKKMDTDFNMMRRYVITEMKDDERTIKSSVNKSNKEINEQLAEMKSEINKMKKTMKKRYKDMSLFFIYSIFEDLSSETSESRINKKLDDMRLFINMAKKNKQWDASLEKETSKFLRNMERRWSSKSKDISSLYSMSLDEL